MMKNSIRYFIDINRPGTVYVGTQESMRDLDAEGAQTDEVPLSFVRNHPDWRVLNLTQDGSLPEHNYNDKVQAYTDCLYALDDVEKLCMIVPEFEEAQVMIESLRNRLYVLWRNIDDVEEEETACR